MKTTRYFEEQVLRKRPYLRREWIAATLAVPLAQLPRGRAMKLHYYPETDSLYIELQTAPGVETRLVADGVNVDLAADGAPVGIDIDHASTKLDLTTLETTALPLKAA